MAHQRRVARPKTAAELGLDLIYTYRYVRAGMVALLFMLVFSVGYQAVLARGCLLGSISAYYFTPARAIFIGALSGLGVLLIVHKARSQEEDVLLDFSGIMAIVVALVPTVPDRRCNGSSSLSPADVADAVRNNIWTLIVVLLGAILVRRVLRRDRPRTPPSAGGTVTGVICGVVLVAELLFFLVKRDSFIALSHGIAAGTMVAGIIAVMVLNALNQPADPRGQRFRHVYYGIAIALGLSLGVAVGLHLWLPGFRHFVLLAELIIIALFMTFWITQTVELWGVEPDQIRRQVATASPAGAVTRRPGGSEPAETG